MNIQPILDGIAWAIDLVPQDPIYLVGAWGVCFPPLFVGLFLILTFRRRLQIKPKA